MKPTPTDTHCPPFADLRRLLLAELGDAEAARLREHLRLCVSCRQLWQNLQMETTAAHTPQLLQPAGDTSPGQAKPPGDDSVLDWSSQASLLGEGGARAPAPPSLTSASSANAPRSFAFLSPPRGEGELGWLAHYRITGLLGEGGMGFVFDAFDTHLHRRAALKVLKPELAANFSFRERFLQEARAAAALPDEHIITIYQVGLENDVPFLAMKFLHGESLEHRLQREGRIPVHEVLRIGREIALGLSAAHERGLIHRDIKPANLWLETPPPEEGTASGPRLSCEYVCRVKLLDFGLARPIHDSRRLTATGLIVGTPAYLAPEQARGQPLDPRCDLFSLGIVLYRMVAGVLPFDGADTLAQLTALAIGDPHPLDQWAPETPSGLRILIHKLLARDPAHRPPTARAVAEALRALEKGETLPASLVEGGGRRVEGKKSSSRSVSKKVWAGALAFLLLLGGWAVWKGLPFREANNAVVPPDKEPIKVGVLFSLRGSMASGGAAAHDAVLLALDELNQQGGLLGRKIVAVDGDGESDYRKFAKLAKKFITEDGVSALFGTRASTNRKAVLPIVEEYKNLLFYPMQFEGLEDSPNIIYLGAAPNQQILPALDYMIGIGGKRRIFLIGSDYIYPHAANEIIRDHLRLRHPDVQIVGEAYIPFGGTEVHEAVRILKAKNPDLIVNTINGDSNSAFFRGLQQAGLHAEQTPVLSFSMGENDLLSLGEAGVGHYAAWSYFQSIDRPENREFIRKFRERFGARRVLSDPMETIYFGVYLWAQAVQAAGTVEPSAVIQAIKGRSFEAPEGRVRIDRDTQYTWRVLRLGQVKEDGQFEIRSNNETPQRPTPFPASRLRGEWERFLKNLYGSWGERWQAPTIPKN